MRRMPTPYSWSRLARLIGALGLALTRLACRIDEHARDRFLQGAARKVGLPGIERVERLSTVRDTELLPPGVDWAALRRQFELRDQRRENRGGRA